MCVIIFTKYLDISGTSYPAAIASKDAGTAAVSNNLGWPDVLASPSNASLNSFSNDTKAVLSSAPLKYVSKLKKMYHHIFMSPFWVTTINKWFTKIENEMTPWKSGKNTGWISLLNRDKNKWNDIYRSITLITCHFWISYNIPLLIIL